MEDIWEATYRRFRNSLAALTVPVFSDPERHLLWPVAISQLGAQPRPVGDVVDRTNRGLKEKYGVSAPVTLETLCSKPEFIVLSALYSIEGQAGASPSSAATIALSELAARHSSEISSTLQRVFAALDTVRAGSVEEDEFRECLRRGAALFDAHLYFECHEYLEGIWLEEQGDRRRVLQGLIQLAVGFHHAEARNDTGAVELLRRGLDRLDAVPARLETPAVVAIRQAARKKLAELRNPRTSRGFRQGKSEK